jgi:hypothetical protein
MKQLLSDSLAVYLLLGLLGVLTVISLAWLWFMVNRPERWSQLVDKENDFWVGKGMVSASKAEWFRRFEKGFGQKVLVAIAALLGATGFVGLALDYWRQNHG